MSRESLIQYGAVAAAVVAIIIDRKNVSKYVPAALFAALYANVWCYIAIYFNLWTFPQRLLPFVQDTSFIVNMIVVPIIAIIWIKHFQRPFWKKAVWAFVWTAGLTLGEVVLERKTEIIDYHNGYDWYFSFILWFFSWYIWSEYHKWQIRKIIQIENIR